ncbi:MAG: hypothetical protein HY785_04695 [Oscillatoriophycideae cyanobacterium NC_groundwater_1537_Pr4_S-0.65um_50_18]|nr:hypothetical protein [Oscillatoriophycideae cyanobacterium NC_groundwater_1537_Pr4_S-0.65um_50_18]
MTQRLLGIFLLQLSLGLVLGVFAAPWWILGSAIALATAAVDLNTDDSSGKITGGTLSVVFFLAMIPFMALAIGLLLLNMLSLVWLTPLTGDSFPIGTTLLTTLYLMFMAGVGDWAIRTWGSRVIEWLWLPSVGLATLWALSLASWQTTPEWVLAVESTLRWARIFLESVTLQSAVSFLYQSVWLYHLADRIAAFGLAWIVGIFSTVPPAKRSLLQGGNPQRAVFTLLSVLYGGVGAGWLIGRWI